MSKSLRTHVTFTTQIFNTEEEKDYFVNPTCFGDDLAQWLIERLSQQPLGEVDPEPTQEDWGWCFFVKVGQQDLMIGLGLYEEASTPNTWLVFIKPRLSWFGKRLSGQADAAESQVMFQILDRALTSEPQISNIRWHMEKDFMKGREDNWCPKPIEGEL